ncbi:MAG: acyl-CoA desaturase, partial [Actinomycetota bacterium]
MAAISGGHQVLARSRAFNQPRRGEIPMPATKGRRWGTLGFMAVIHGLAIYALLPQFWSWQAVATLAVLYWLTACMGVTIGYHRLLCHRAFRVPQWLER